MTDVRVLNTYPFGDADRARIAGVSPRVRLVDSGPNTLESVGALRDDEAEVLLSDWPPLEPGGLPRLRWLQSCHAGMNYLLGRPHRGPERPGLGPAAAFWDRLTVTNASGVVNRSMAEYVLSAILLFDQRVPQRRANQERRGWPQDAPGVRALGGSGLRGRRLLIVGYGSTGREVARLASAFGMSISAVKARPDALPDERFHLPGTGDPEGRIPSRIVGPEALADAARDADILVNALPLTSGTAGLITAEVLAALPEGAWLISVGRGGAIDEDALLAALQARHLGAAMLDVTAREPLAPDHPLWSAPGAFITPHVAGASEAEWSFLADLVVANLERYLAGERLWNVVDPTRGY